MIKTPMNQWHVDSGARMIDFFGFHMPVLYSSIIDEVEATRKRAGIFDLTHMGRLEVSGPDREAVVQAACTKNVEKIPVGAARYGLLLTPEGTIKDDVLVYREEDLLHVVVNCANRRGDFEHFLEHAEGRDATVRNVSDDQAMIALQGPRSIDILAPLTDTDLEALGYYRFLRAKVAGHDAILSRTGYTGEDGFELFVAPEAGLPIWEAIVGSGEPHGLAPIGLGARDVLRLEAAMPLYGQELSLELNPLEADVGFGVSMKSEFTGRDALVRFKEAGLTRKRIGFEVASRRIPRTDMGIVKNGEKVGWVTSGTLSPTLEKVIGMGYVPVELAEPGTELEIDVKGKPQPARVVELPFYKRER